MLTNINNKPGFARNGFPNGEITDGDSHERPEGSAEIILNMDYDVETGKVVTRNSTSDSGVLSGFVMPQGYAIMPGGIKFFSFNEPVDRLIVLLFVKNASTKQVRIYVNNWYNPPAPNTEEPFKTNQYENHIKSKDIGWNANWTEITEYSVIVDFAIAENYKCTADPSIFDGVGEDYYRGWQIWNATKWNSDVALDIKNKSFACIDSFKDGIFTIQQRPGLGLNDMEWHSGDECFLVRYPAIVHTAIKTSQEGSGVNLGISFEPTSKDWLIKTNTAIEVLTGKDGNLWFGFVNKDIAKETGYIEEFIVSNTEFTPPERNYAVISGEATSNAEHTLVVKLTAKNEVYSQTYPIQDWTIITGQSTKFRMVTQISLPYQQRFVVGNQVRIEGTANNCNPNVNGRWEVSNVEVEEIGYQTWEETVTLSHIALTGNVATGGSAKKINTTVVNWTWTKQLDGAAPQNLFSGNSVLNTDYDIYEGVKVRFTSMNFEVNDKITISITKILQGTAELNQYKRYGWWIDYQQFPVIPLIAKPANQASNKYSLDEKIGVKIDLQQEAESGSKITVLGLLGVLDNRQSIMLAKLRNKDLPSDKAYRIEIQNYHHYSRRLTGYKRYGNDSDSLLDDTSGFTDPNYAPYFSQTEGRLLYAPIYGLGTMNTIKMQDPNAGEIAEHDGSTLEAEAQYQIEEPIFNNAKIGVFSQGRLFVVDPDYPDSIKYSLFQKEDVIPKQNTHSVDATDKDKIRAMTLLGVNPVVFKDNSIHVATIEGQTEIGWRLIETKSKIGCKYPDTITKTDRGISFCDDQGVWLLTGVGEPINLINKRKQKAYLNLNNKSEMFAEWYGKHKEIWLYVGNKTFWVCKVNDEEAKIGWKTYVFGFTPIGLILNDDNDLYIIGSNYAYKYDNDYELEDGNDADGLAIQFKLKENPETISRKTNFRWTSTEIGIDSKNKDNIIPNGNEATVTLKIYDELGNVVKEENKTWNVLAAAPLTLAVTNDKFSRQSELVREISGTLGYLKQFAVTELNTEISNVPELEQKGAARI